MMKIKDYVHIEVVSIINHFLYPGKELGVNGICTVLNDVVVPGHRYTDGLKTSVMYGFYKFRGNLWVSPGGFLTVYVCPVSAGGVKCIAEIPAKSHIIHNFSCSKTGKLACSLGRNGRAGKIIETKYACCKYHHNK